MLEYASLGGEVVIDPKKKKGKKKKG